MFVETIPIDAMGAALLAIGCLLMVGEVWAPAHGAMASLGLLIILGEIIATVSPVAAGILHGTIGLVLAVIATAGGVAASVMTASTRRRRIVTGREAMIGATGSVLSWAGGAGHILVHGERWRASGAPRSLHDDVRIVEIDGLTLRVQPADLPSIDGVRDHPTSASGE